MTDLAIKVDDLSKAYRIGLEEEMNDTFVGAALDLLRQPIRNFRRLNRLSTFSEQNADAEDIIWALDHVSFAVEPGEIVGVIGHNGAGKSTLLKVLSRITFPSSGRVSLRGRVSSLLEVGTGFHPELTGRENVYLNGTILGMTRTEINNKFDQIVEFSGIGKFIDTPVKRYSSGMQVRLAFSVAAHLEPDILLVDEVLAVGDADFRRKSLGKMGDVASEGRAVLLVSHNMTAVSTLCQRVIWMENGRIRMDGETQDVISTYLRTTTENKQIVGWDDPETAPGNENARLRQVAVVSVDDAGNLRDPRMVQDDIHMDDPFAIVVDFDNHSPDAEIDMSIQLVNDRGIVAFASSTLEQEKPLTWRLGHNRIVLHIPPNLMNSGYYSINVRFVENAHRAFVQLNGVVGLDVINRKEYKGRYYGTLHGVVRPILHWEQQVISHELGGGLERR